MFVTNIQHARLKGAAVLRANEVVEPPLPVSIP
ncbi:hypothetical protein A4W95_00246 [Treponema pallidum subsp. pallidum]|nr:hypothetical protein A4W95_00246 [Treponema pallidum subsp. pallidum]